MVNKKQLIEDNGIDELKELVKLETELENLHHKHRMAEIIEETNGKKEAENLKFDHEMQIQRIRSAEIKKTIDRKAIQNDFKRSYPQ